MDLISPLHEIWWVHENPTVFGCFVDDRGHTECTIHVSLYSDETFDVRVRETCVDPNFWSGWTYLEEPRIQTLAPPGASQPFGDAVEMVDADRLLVTWSAADPGLCEYRGFLTEYSARDLATDADPRVWVEPAGCREQARTDTTCFLSLPDLALNMTDAPRTLDVRHRETCKDANAQSPWLSWELVLQPPRPLGGLSVGSVGESWLHVLWEPAAHACRNWTRKLEYRQEALPEESAWEAPENCTAHNVPVDAFACNLTDLPGNTTYLVRLREACVEPFSARSLTPAPFPFQTEPGSSWLTVLGPQQPATKLLTIFPRPYHCAVPDAGPARYSLCLRSPELRVTRTDRPSGWGQALTIRCVTQTAWFLEDREVPETAADPSWIALSRIEEEPFTALKIEFGLNETAAPTCSCATPEVQLQAQAVHGVRLIAPWTTVDNCTDMAAWRCETRGLEPDTHYAVRVRIVCEDDRLSSRFTYGAPMLTKNLHYELTKAQSEVTLSTPCSGAYGGNRSCPYDPPEVASAIEDNNAVEVSDGAVSASNVTNWTRCTNSNDSNGSNGTNGTDCGDADANDTNVTNTSDTNNGTVGDSAVNESAVNDSAVRCRNSNGSNDSNGSNGTDCGDADVNDTNGSAANDTQNDTAASDAAAVVARPVFRDAWRVLLAEVGEDTAVACYRTGYAGSEPTHAECRFLSAEGTVMSMSLPFVLGRSSGLALAGLPGLAVACRRALPADVTCRTLNTTLIGEELAVYPGDDHSLSGAARLGSTRAVVCAQRAGEEDSSFVTCSALAVEGEALTAGPALELVGSSNMTNATLDVALAPLGEGSALACYRSLPTSRIACAVLSADRVNLTKGPELLLQTASSDMAPVLSPLGAGRTLICFSVATEISEDPPDVNGSNGSAVPPVPRASARCSLLLSQGQAVAEAQGPPSRELLAGRSLSHPAAAQLDVERAVLCLQDEQGSACLALAATPDAVHGSQAVLRAYADQGEIYSLAHLRENKTVACRLVEGAATCNVVTPKGGTIRGVLTLAIVGDPETFASDPAVAAAVKLGIATGLPGVDPSWIEITISVISAARRLALMEAHPRLLSSHGSVLVEFAITIPAISGAVVADDIASDLAGDSATASVGSGIMGQINVMTGYQVLGVLAVEGTLCSAPTGIADSAALACAEGTVVQSGGVCTAACAAGYSPSVQNLTCSGQTLAPATFECLPDPCPVPALEAAAAGGLCASGASELASGGDCEAACAQGYTPSAPVLSCSTGTLTPANLTCDPDPCPAPTGVTFGAAAACLEGSVVESGGTCTAQCQRGYRPLAPVLNCSLGVLSPSTYECEEIECESPAGVVNASVEPCVLPDLTVDNACLTRCEAGFGVGPAGAVTGEPAVLSCVYGVLEPATFTCPGRTCAAPSGVANAWSGALGACLEGPETLHGGECTTRCEPGYHPSVAALSCWAEVLSPSSFECLPDPCPAPTGIEHAAGAGACAGGDVIVSGDACMARCVAGFTPSEPWLNCSLGALSPAAFACLPDPCPAPGDVANAAADGACLEGDSVSSGTPCSTRCGEGYEPSLPQLLCYAGTLSPPSFSCEPLACAAPTGIEHLSFAGACLEGASINSSGRCTPLCTPGFSSTDEMLNCSLGVLSPGNFTCLGDPCPAPAGIPHAAQPSSCAQGSLVGSGGACVSKCEAGYDAYPPQLQCSAGVLSPAAFACEPSPCMAPAGIAHAVVNGSCVEGAYVNHSEQCTAACEFGYAPSAAILNCSLGQLSPPSYTCVAQPCAAPAVDFALSSGSCESGHFVASGSRCVAACEPGYNATETSLNCEATVLTPPGFACIPLPCEAPAGVASAAPLACAEGDRIESGGTCTARCVSGYTPSAATLGCLATVLDPVTFECLPDPCPVPTTVPNANPTLPCGPGALLDSGSTCAPSCQAGYTSTEASLSCFAGNLTPPVFGCEPDPCEAPSGMQNLAGALACAEGAVIASGDGCTPRCAEGYSPTAPHLSCLAAVLSPASFTCEPDPCPSPSWIFGVHLGGCQEGNLIASGGNCTPACEAGRTASEQALQCSLGILTPLNFTCDEDPCHAPTNITHAAHAVHCAEGSLIRPGEVCTPQCAEGYEPSVPTLPCRLGGLRPATYLCQAATVKNVSLTDVGDDFFSIAFVPQDVRAAPEGGRRLTAANESEADPSECVNPYWRVEWRAAGSTAWIEGDVAGRIPTSWPVPRVCLSRFALRAEPVRPSV